MKVFFGLSWLFCVGIISGIAVFGPFPWFGLNAVAWFGGFLAVVLAVVYMVVNYRMSSGGSPTTTGGGGGRRSKGAKKDR